MEWWKISGLIEEGIRVKLLCVFLLILSSLLVLYKYYYFHLREKLLTLMSTELIEQLAWRVGVLLLSSTVRFYSTSPWGLIDSFPLKSNGLRRSKFIFSASESTNPHKKLALNVHCFLNKMLGDRLVFPTGSSELKASWESCSHVLLK